MAAASVLLKAASGGAFTTFSTTKLISVDDALAAFRPADELQHRPPRPVCIARGPYGHLRIRQVSHPGADQWLCVAVLISPSRHLVVPNGGSMCGPLTRGGYTP